LEVTQENINEGFEFLDSLQAPYVLKADGLAAGKGVLILYDIEEAKRELSSMLDGKFGNASSTVVIEQFLSGIEFSVFALTDGKNYVILPEAKDYKRIGEGDTGLNTGGMGAISPVSFVDQELWVKVTERIIKPTIDGLSSEDIDYVGFVFFGLINVGGNPFVIEYNCRMGDPETEVVIPRIKSDFVDMLIKTAKGEVNDINLDIDSRHAATVMLVSGGYPGEFVKGHPISIPDKMDENTIVFHAGTSTFKEKVMTSGGRVIAVTSMGENFKECVKISLNIADSIDYQDKYYRKDIGFDL
jgi:phosphoribosylamine---glycine ligase